MENKRIGVIVLLITIVLLGIFVILINSLQSEAERLGCYQSPSCQKLDTSLTMVHFAFGFFGFLFALGVYLVFFSKGEEAIVRRLEKDTAKDLAERRFSILLKGLDSFEKKVLTVVNEQEGITQNTLHLRTDMSKAKLSQVLSSLEKKGLITRKQEGKSLAIFMKEKFEG